MAKHMNVDVLASFPAPTFLENLAVRQDNSILVTAYDRGTLHLISPTGESTYGSTPILIHTFSSRCLGISEVESDVFYLSVSDGLSADQEASIWRVDMNTYITGHGISPPTKAVNLPKRAVQLNGSCILSTERKILLVADSWAGIIWRVDLEQSGAESSVSIWLDVPELKPLSEGERKYWGGVNGIKFDKATNQLYWTNTGPELFCRVSVNVNDGTWDATGDVEIVMKSLLGDDFILDEEERVAYVATHGQNTIERVTLDGESRTTILGKPVDERLLCPTAIQWYRGSGKDNRQLIITATGGIVAPIDGKVRDATVIRLNM